LDEDTEKEMKGKGSEGRKGGENRGEDMPERIMKEWMKKQGMGQRKSRGERKREQRRGDRSERLREKVG
jgi:hypothetical protein